MPKIHYFQRYSSKENTVTNNTLQLLLTKILSGTNKLKQRIEWVLTGRQKGTIINLIKMINLQVSE